MRSLSSHFENALAGAKGPSAYADAPSMFAGGVAPALGLQNTFEIA